MKTVGDKLTAFAITGVKPGQPEDAYFTITEKSFEGKWKVIVYYPKDFTFVCPTEIVAYDKLTTDFADRDAVLLTGSTEHITVNNLDVGRNPEETLRVLDALQTGELCPCNRAIGGATL